MAYYQGDISNLLSTVNTNISNIGNNLYKSVLLGSTNANYKRNLRLLGIGRNLLSNQITLTSKPTFLYKFTILDSTVQVDIDISTDGTLGNTMETIVLNTDVNELTKQQAAEELARQFKDVSYDFNPVTSSDIETIVLDDAVFIYSSSPYFTSNVEITLSDTDAISTTSYLDNISGLINTLNNGGSIDNLIPNIIDITNEYKDREDFNKDNPNPYSIKNIQLLAESATTASTSTGTNTVSGHNQNTDSYLAKNTANQVSAAELRTHLDNNDIHLTQAQIQALIDTVSLDDLTDVDLTGITDDYILIYDNASGKWKPEAINISATLSGLTDTDVSGVMDNYILRYNSSTSKWEAKELVISSTFLDLTDTPNSYDASELVAANGGGDALIFSGITTTQINTALSQLALLIPAVPPLITTRDLVLSSYFSAKDATLGTTRTYVTIDTTPRIQLSSMTDAYAFYDPQAGVLFAVVNGSSIGSIALDNTDNSGTNLDLTITQNEDYYLGQTGKEGFYDAILARIDVSSPLSAQAAAHTAKLSIDNTDDTNTLSFYVESTLAPSIGSTSLTVSGSDPNLVEISGIKVLGNGCDINVSAVANNVIGYFFNATRVIRLSDGIIGTNDYSPVAPVAGSNFSITTETVSVGNNDYDATYEVPITIYTPDGTTVSGTIAPPSGFMIVDSVSDESSRLAVGSGQYPTTGYTGSYNSATSLLSNEALQVSNGKHIYPSTDYSTLYPTNGPDYSGITGYRYSVFSLGSITNASSVSFTINGATGFSSVIESNVRIYVKVEGVTGWLDANAAYSAGVPASNGDAALDFGASTATSKRVTFGATTRTGTVYVRIGLNTGSSKTFTSIS